MRPCRETGFSSIPGHTQTSANLAPIPPSTDVGDTSTKEQAVWPVERTERVTWGDPIREIPAHGLPHKPLLAFSAIRLALGDTGLPGTPSQRPYPMHPLGPVPSQMQVQHTDHACAGPDLPPLGQPLAPHLEMMTGLTTGSTLSFRFLGEPEGLGLPLSEPVGAVPVPIWTE